MFASRSWLLALVASAIPSVLAQGLPSDQTDAHNLTPDWFWHNRYFALLGMGSYGDYNETCPTQTFTRQEQLKNFPDSTYPPWTLLETWSTPSGCVGFSAIVPEMNKVLLVFQGNWSLESNLSTDVTPWSSFLTNSTGICDGCTANSFAVQGYNEAKEATNFWEITRNAYYGAGLVFAITGHGLGGMHALIASVEFNAERICYYSHNHGTPRTFNPAGVAWYNSNFNGEAGERATWNNDQMGESIPASDDYAHAGTAFYYWGYDASTGQPNTYICWNDPDDGGCQPQDQGLSASIQEQHYFYFANVGQCGGSTNLNRSEIQNFLGDDYDPTWSVPGFQNSPFQSTTYLPATFTSDDGGDSSPTGNNGPPVVTQTQYYTTTTNDYYTQPTEEDTYTFYPPTTTTYYQQTTQAPPPTTRTRTRTVPTRYTTTTRNRPPATTQDNSGSGGDGSGSGSDGSGDSGNDGGDGNSSS